MKTLKQDSLGNRVNETKKDFVCSIFDVALDTMALYKAANFNPKDSWDRVQVRQVYFDILRRLVKRGLMQDFDFGAGTITSLDGIVVDAKTRKPKQ
jgi:hypothetical protein